MSDEAMHKSGMILLIFSYILLLGIGSAASQSQSFEERVLQAHNRYRSRHGVPPLQLSNEISRFASGWARYLLANNIMKHRDHNPYGENLYMASGGNLSPESAVDAWYAEIKDYRWNNPTFSMKTGHFTQVVWKSSKYLGVGYARRGNTIYVVCNYNPPGNYMGQFDKNVFPPRK